jgi:beta-lactamase regulating signal transducer with metallopeptidase domain
VEDIQLKLTVRDFFGYVLAYFLWLLAVLAAMWTVFEARNALNVMWPALGSGIRWQWTLRAVDRFGLVFLGLVWLVYAIFCEHYYRSAITAVRIREYRGRKAPALQSGQARWAARQLARMGLDVLAFRVAVTIVPPIALWLVSFLIKQLAFWLLFYA